MLQKLKSLVRDNAGVTAIEYGVIAGFIIVAAAGIITTVGTNLTTAFTTVSTKL